MINIPIVSFSANNSLFEFINKLVNKNHYENKSKLIRDALLRLMSTIPDTMDGTGISTIDEIILPRTKSIIGNIIFSYHSEDSQAIHKKINKIEHEYKDQIVSKNQHFVSNHISIFIIFEGLVQDFQKSVVEINSIKEIKNFRYMILK